MAALTFFDLNSALIELEQLERLEHEVSARRRALQDRLDAFPNEVARRRERQISDERRRLHRKIDELRAQLELQDEAP